MQITNLTNPHGTIYSCNAYLVRGDWNTLDDVNTLIDSGNDPAIVARLQDIYTGVGKRPVEQVILTHHHFDHAGVVGLLRAHFAPTVYAFSTLTEPDHLLHDGQQLRCGDRLFQVIHTPGHTEDSICLYCQTDGVLFVGDTPVIIQSPDATYDQRFIVALKHLSEKEIRTIYPGHGNPITENANAVIQSSLRILATL